MAFGHSKDSRVLLNERHVSGQITSWNVSNSRDLGDATTILSTGQQYIPGLQGGSLKIEGLFDSAAFLGAEIEAATGVDNDLLVTVLPQAATIGAPAIIVMADVTNYDVQSTVTDTVKISLDAQPDDGVDHGILLHAYAAETATGNGVGQDNAVATANGGVATLHVTDWATLTSAVVKIQDSADNVSFADIITFTTATAATKERKLLAAGTAVRRYVRAIVTIVGSGSTTYAVAFARR